MTAETMRILDAVKRNGRTALLEHEAIRVCKAYGIPTPEFEIANTPEEAVLSCRRIGYPVALKIVSPQILHKTEAGGVVLNIRDDGQVEEGFQLVVSRARKCDPKCSIVGVLVENMIPPGTEIIAGALRDEQFGPTVMFGLGGVFTEAIRDVSFRLAPISRYDANDMIKDLRFSSVLKGFRGKPPPDLKAVAELLLNVSRIITENTEIDSIDLNPVVVHEKGAIAADARVVLARQTG